MLSKVVFVSAVLILQTIIHLTHAQVSTSTLDESCLAVVKDIISEHGKELLCQTPSGMLYIIPSVDNGWIDEKMLMGELVSGEVLMDIPYNTTVNRKTQTLLTTEPPTFIDYYEFEGRRRRQLARTTGDKTVLVVRVVASNSAASKTERELSAAVFGGVNDLVNLKSQYAACSHGKLEIQKRADMDGLSTKIRNGVVTIQVDMPVQVGHSTMVNEVSRRILEEFGLTTVGIANHVMYCLPEGAYTGTGFAIMNKGLSVYNDEICTSVSAQMHEVG